RPGRRRGCAGAGRAAPDVARPGGSARSRRHRCADVGVRVWTDRAGRGGSPGAGGIEVPMCSRIFMLTLLAALAALLAACGADDPPKPTATPLPGTVLNPPRPIEDFTLTDHTGAPFSLSDLEGRP